MRLRYTMRNPLIEFIEKHDRISIFRHIHPDGDALGSQWGLATFIEEHYPDKKVYVVGENDEISGFYPKSTSVSIELIKSSGAIVLDSANEFRVDGPFQKATEVLNIDHHPTPNPYGDVVIVDANRSSTCEIVAELLIEYPLSQEAATYLLSGIITDTLRFMVENTKPETLVVASKLMEYGANINHISRFFFNQTYEEYRLKTELSKMVEYESGFAYLIIDEAKRKALGLSAREAKSYHHVMANVSDFEVYGIFVEETDGIYIGSLRSQDITINDISAQFNGGGHRLACGVKGLLLSDISILKGLIIDRIKTSK